jgi:hypothetical protein
VQSQKSGSGQVKHPESDKRLKENQTGNKSAGQKGSASSEPDRDEDGKFVKSASSKSGQEDGKRASGHTPGAVTDPEHDGRLKENRDKGMKKSDDR